MTMINNRRGLDDGGKSVWRRVNARLLPPLFAVALCCQLDRSNLAFAALQMDGDLGFSRTVHGIGSGLFFIGYLAQVPANMLCVALGPTRWLPILLVCWGAVAMCFAAISGTASFLVLRLLLGVAEAGAYPAIMYLLSLFYPPRMLGMAYTTVATATAVAGLLGAPLAAALTLLDGVGGLRGWQAMFLAEGLLPILLAAALPFLLPSSPLTARFLAPAEQQWLWQQVHGCRDVELVATPAGAEAAAMVASTEPSTSPAHEGHAADDTLLPREQGGAVHDRAADVERASHSNVEHAALLDPAQAASDESGASQHAKADGWEPGSHSSSSWAALRVGLSDSRIWHLACAMLLIDLTMNSINFFLPSLVRAALLGELQEDASPDSSSTESIEHGASSSTALLIKSSLLSALPFCGAAVCMVGNAWHAQRADERRLHTVVPMCFAALGLAATPLLSALGPGFALTALTLAASGIWATHGPFFSWPSALLDHKAAAIGFALVKTGGAVGGFLGPFGVGALADAFHGYTAAMLMLAGVALAAGALVFAFRDRR